MNCHIPEDAELTDEKIKASLYMAEEFLLRLQSAYGRFICYGWLLYPPILEALGNDFGLRCLSSFFKIVSSCIDDSQAGEDIRKGSILQGILDEHSELFGYAFGVRQVPLSCNHLQW